MTTQRNASSDRDRGFLRLITGREPSIEGGRAAANDLAAEAMILSGMMLAAEQRATARWALTREHFYSDAHRQIFRALCALDDDGKLAPGDGPETMIVLLRAWLGDRGLIQRAGGSRYLGEVLHEAPSTTQFEELCARVGQLWRIRRMVEAAQNIAREGYEPEVAARADEWLVECVAAVQHIADDHPATEVDTAADAAAVAIERARARHDPDGHRYRGLTLPMRALNAKTGGLFLGESTAITAETGGGKTLCAGQIAEHIAETSLYAAGIWSLEMPKEQLVDRMAIGRAGVSAHAFRNGRLNAKDFGRYELALDELRGLPLFFDSFVPKRGWRTVESILATMNRYAKMAPKRWGRPLGLMVLDFVQKLDFSGIAKRNDNREKQINIGSDMIVREAERLNIALLMLCQTNDDGAIRESKAVTHHCHGWWQLEINKDRHAGWGANVRVAKARHGRKGLVRIGFNPVSVRFQNESGTDEPDLLDI